MNTELPHQIPSAEALPDQPLPLCPFEGDPSEDAPTAETPQGPHEAWVGKHRLHQHAYDALCQVFPKENIDTLWCYLQRFCQKWHYTAEDFEDLYQDILLEFAKILMRETPPQDIVPFLKRVMCNVAIEHLRHHFRERARFVHCPYLTPEELDDFIAEFGRLKPSEAGPVLFEHIAHTLDLPTLLNAVPQALRTLAKNLSVDDIQTALERSGIPRSTYYGRIRRELRQALAPYVVLD